MDMARKINHTNSSKAHLFSLTLSLMWYIWFLFFIFKPGLILTVFGSQSWSIYILALTFLAMFSVMGFFTTAIQSPRPNNWRQFLLLNGVLVTVPLYFLWWTYLL